MIITDFDKFARSPLSLKRKVPMVLRHFSPRALTIEDIALKLKIEEQQEKIAQLLKEIVSKNNEYVVKGKRYFYVKKEEDKLSNE